MYRIEKKQEQYVNYHLLDTTSNTSCVITPEKGGMCTSFCIDGEEMIYINEENYRSNLRTRCAFPILFPINGRCENDTLSLDGVNYPMGIHGIAHAQAWEVVETNTSERASITIRLSANEITLKSYPYHFVYELTYSLQGNKLRLDVHIQNMGEQEMLFTYGFHPYFVVSDVRNLEFHIPSYNDQNEEGAFVEKVPLVFPYQEETKVTLSDISSPCGFLDKQTGKEVWMEFDGGIKYVILWSLCQQNFLCMEPWNSLPNGLHEGQGERIKAWEAYRTTVSFTFKK